MTLEVQECLLFDAFTFNCLEQKHHKGHVNPHTNIEKNSRF